MDEVGQYYTQEKANHCVVCGSNGSYIRKNVVPREYRKHFPGKLSIEFCSTSVMLFNVEMSHGVHDPFRSAWQSSSVCVFGFRHFSHHFAFVHLPVTLLDMLESMWLM